MNFFAERFDVQVVLGLTLVGVPESWDEITLVGFVKSYSYAFGPNEVGIVSTFIETSTEGVRLAHITCNNLYSKQVGADNTQKLLKIRLIPVIDGEQEKFCQIITVRPYCFWIKLKTEAPPVPFMLPKYGSRDVSYESVEAQMLLHKNNIHPSIVTCLMEFSLIPRGNPHLVQRQDEERVALQLPRVAAAQGAAGGLDVRAVPVRPQGRPRVRLKLDAAAGARTGRQRNAVLLAVGADRGAAADQARETGKIGCIRWEVNRKRWVVDMSYAGKRLQKCFHETYYGIEGGLKEAMRWRVEFLKRTNASLSGEYELRVLEDILDKVLHAPFKDSKKQKLIDILKVPVDEVGTVVTPDQILLMICRRLSRKDRREDPRAESDGGSSNTDAEPTQAAQHAEIAEEQPTKAEVKAEEAPEAPKLHGNNANGATAPAEKQAGRYSFRGELRKHKRIWDPEK